MAMSSRDQMDLYAVNRLEMSALDHMRVGDLGCSKYMGRIALAYVLHVRSQA